MAVDITSSAKSLLGGFSFGGAWSLLSYGILFLVIAGVVIFFVSRHLMAKKFNKTITIFRRNSQTGLLVADQTIKAMTIRLDSFGNLGYRLQHPYETKNLIVKLKYEAKQNTHYVEYTRDGKIVEIAGFDDYDDKRKAVGATFMDDNTELGRSSMHQMNKERYEKTSFWKENATLLVNIGAMVVIMVFLWLIADKLIGLVGSIQSLVEKMGTLQDAQNNIINSLNNILNAHGLVPK